MVTYLSIQEVAADTGLSPHTLRYYERIGLIHAVARNSGGQRRYAAADLEWIRFLMRLRATGMPIAAMLRYAELRRGGSETIAERRSMLEQHLASVLQEAARLQELSGFLAEKVELYREMERMPSTSAPERKKRHAKPRT